VLLHGLLLKTANVSIVTSKHGSTFGFINRYASTQGFERVVALTANFCGTHTNWNALLSCVCWQSRVAWNFAVGNAAHTAVNVTKSSVDLKKIK